MAHESLHPMNLTVWVKLLSGEMIAIETSSDVSCAMFYEAVVDALPEDVRPKYCWQSQMTLVAGDSDELVVPISEEPLVPTDGKIFTLLLDERAYEVRLSQFEEVCNTEENPIHRYEAVQVSIYQMGTESRQYQYTTIFYICLDQAIVTRNVEDVRIRDGDGIRCSRFRNAIQFEMTETAPFYLPEEMMDVTLQRVEQKMETSLFTSTKSYLKRELMRQYMEIIEPTLSSNISLMGMLGMI
jgi:hypothetical protein